MGWKCARLSRQLHQISLELGVTHPTVDRAAEMRVQAHKVNLDYAKKARISTHLQEH